MRGVVLSHREIAELLGMSHSNVIIIEQRALRKLRMLMAKRGLTPDAVRP